MSIGSVFPGDNNKPLMRLQHSVYGPNLAPLGPISPTLWRPIGPFVSADQPRMTLES